MKENKKVLVSGCYDIFHAGHVEFFRQASEYGDLYVSVASDETLERYKRPPFYTEGERLFIVSAIRYVAEAFISKDDGGDVMFNFLADFLRLKPDVLVVTDDGDYPGKRELCEKHGVEYVVLKRDPFKGLPSRSTTSIIEEIKKF